MLCRRRWTLPAGGQLQYVPVPMAASFSALRLPSPLPSPCPRNAMAVITVRRQSKNTGTQPLYLVPSARLDCSTVPTVREGCPTWLPYLHHLVLDDAGSQRLVSERLVDEIGDRISIHATRPRWKGGDRRIRLYIYVFLLQPPHLVTHLRSSLDNTF